MATDLRVHNPMGYPPQIDQKHLAPRVSDLAGKTVYLVDCRFDDGDILVEHTEIQRKGAGAVMAVGH